VPPGRLLDPAGNGWTRGMVVIRSGVTPIGDRTRLTAFSDTNLFCNYSDSKFRGSGFKVRER